MGWTITYTSRYQNVQTLDGGIRINETAIFHVHAQYVASGVVGYFQRTNTVSTSAESCSCKSIFCKIPCPFQNIGYVNMLP